MTYAILYLLSVGMACLAVALGFAAGRLSAHHPIRARRDAKPELPQGVRAMGDGGRLYGPAK